MILVLVLYLAFLLGYVILAGIIVWNIKRYILIQDKKGRWIIGFFVIAALVLIIFSSVSFSITPWDELLNLKFYASTKTK
jgi:hypothetical protein